MSFKIKVDDAVFEWKNDTLNCDNAETMAEFKRRLKMHIPTMVVPPDLIDFDDDLTDGRNVYFAITGLFENHEVLKEPSDEFLDYGHVAGRIY